MTGKVSGGPLMDNHGDHYWGGSTHFLLQTSGSLSCFFEEEMVSRPQLLSCLSPPIERKYPELRDTRK